MLLYLANFSYTVGVALLISAVSALPAEEVNRKHHRQHELGDKFPQVQSMVMTDESVAKHKTEKYRESLGFAVRRGYDLHIDMQHRSWA